MCKVSILGYTFDGRVRSVRVWDVLAWVFKVEICGCIGLGAEGSTMENQKAKEITNIK